MSFQGLTAAPARADALRLLVVAMAAGGLLALPVLASGVGSTTTVGISLVFLAMAGGVLSNWSP